MARIKDLYYTQMLPALKKELGYANIMQVPRLTKIVINMGLGEAATNTKLLESSIEEIALIAGQKPIVTRAHKSIANFKLREGMTIGCAVTLRGERMYEFFDRLVNVALPRVRDFRGISDRSFDGRGNYSLGIREQVIFPEIDYNSIDRIRGLQVNIVTTAPTDAEGLRFLELMGMPFARTRDAARVA